MAKPALRKNKEYGVEFKLRAIQVPVASAPAEP